MRRKSEQVQRWQPFLQNVPHFSSQIVIKISTRIREITYLMMMKKN